MKPTCSFFVSLTVKFSKPYGNYSFHGFTNHRSMLNKSGACTLYFGVKNDGTIYGLEIGRHTTADISRAIKEHLKPSVIPNIEVITIEGKKIVEIKAQGEDTPYSAYGRYYIRSDDEDLIMSNSQLESFFLGKSYDYSKWEKEATEFGLDDVDEELLIRYVNQGNDSGRINFLYRDVKTTLVKLELLNGDRLNNAGYYLFSNKKPLLLKLATYPTDERISFSDMKQFKGNIFECIDEAVKYVMKAKQITDLQELTPELLHEFIEKIVVHERKYLDGKRYQIIDIYFYGVEIIKELTPEEMEAEFQKLAKQEKSA